MRVINCFMKIDVLGVKINPDSKSTILTEIGSRLDSGKSTFIVTPYSETLVAAQKDEEFRNVLNSADLAVPDGAGVVWAASFLEKIQFERTPGRDFFLDLCALAESRGESVFLLGGFGDTPEIVGQKLKEKFPHLKIAGTSNYPPPLARGGDGGEVEPTGEKNSKIINLINSSNTDFLFVALGPISQEKWIFHNLPNLRVRLAMGVGGTFDYIAGKRPLPPQFLASAGLEWLWRLLTQPWRFFRILKGVLGLIWYVIRARMTH